jgi:hypothetical protein
VGKSLAEVARAVHAKHGATHWIPRIETWRHVYRHVADISELRDTTHSYFYFGSLPRDRGLRRCDRDQGADGRRRYSDDDADLSGEQMGDAIRTAFGQRGQRDQLTNAAHLFSIEDI